MFYQSCRKLNYLVGAGWMIFLRQVTVLILYNVLKFFHLKLLEIKLFFSMLILPSMGLKFWNLLENFDFKGKIVAKFLLRKHFISIYDNKITLTMGTFKKYVTWIIIFFIPFTCVTLCKLYFKTSPALLKISNYIMRKMKFFCI